MGPQIISTESISPTEDLIIRQDDDGMYQGQITSSEGDNTIGRWEHSQDDAVDSVNNAEHNNNR